MAVIAGVLYMKKKKKEREANLAPIEAVKQDDDPLQIDKVPSHRDES